MPLPANGVLQFMLTYESAGQTLRNVVHYRVDIVGGAQDQQTIVNNLVNLMGDETTPGSPAAQMVSILPGNVTILHARMQIVAPVRFAYRERIIDVPGALTDTLTPNVDAVLTKQTDYAGRGFQSNFYIPGLPTDVYSGGMLETVFKTTLENAMAWIDDDVTEPISGATIVPVIWHQFTGGATTDITGYRVQPQVRVMTRRTVGRGE